MMEYINNPINVEDVYDYVKKMPVEITLAALKNCFLMAMINNQFEDNEKTFFNKIFKIIGVTEENTNKMYDILHYYYKMYQLEQEIFNRNN